MGLTREQKWRREDEQRRKRIEYNRIMSPIWAEQARQEADRLTALGMLLNANWSASNGYFVKVIKDDWPFNVVTEFYDRDGNYIGSDQDGR